MTTRTIDPQTATPEQCEQAAAHRQQWASKKRDGPVRLPWSPNWRSTAGERG